MTENQPITAAELAELRRLHDAAKDQGRTARARGNALSELADRLVWNWFDGGDGGLPRLLDEIERLRAVIRRTHTTHCTDWPTHSPWCLLYEVEP